jgi:hypothetical protein
MDYQGSPCCYDRYYCLSEYIYQYDYIPYNAEYL